MFRGRPSFSYTQSEAFHKVAIDPKKGNPLTLQLLTLGGSPCFRGVDTRQSLLTSVNSVCATFELEGGNVLGTFTHGGHPLASADF